MPRLFRLSIQIADQQGQLGLLCNEIGLAGGNINAVVHDRTSLSNDTKSARVEVEIEVDVTTIYRRQPASEHVNSGSIRTARLKARADLK